MDANFLIVVTVYNSDKYIGKCIDSVLSQTYKNYTLIVMDDCSTDETSNILTSLICRKEYYRNDIRIGSAVANIVKGINLCPGDREDVILIIDGDDWLYDETVLDYLNKVYQNPEIWLTYGQFTSLSKRMENYCKPLTSTKEYRRRGRWCTSHPKTIKRKLWDKIKDEDMRDDNGEYFKRFEDTAYMYPAIEMAGLKHIKYIDKILYVYNDLNSACSLNEYSERKRLEEILPIKWCILRKPRYNELRNI